MFAVIVFSPASIGVAPLADLKVITPKGLEIPIQTPADFEKQLSVRYLASLEYANEKVAERLEKRY